MNADQIAVVCHEANRAYCIVLGDSSQPHWVDAPEWQRTSAVNGATAHLASIAAGQEPAPDWSHNLWLKEKKEAGWVYGSVKDPTTKKHPCMVPFESLPEDQKRKDVLFAAIVKALA